MIVFISDIHANLPALEAVLSDIDSRYPSARIWCLGDTVGYGADVNECLRLVFERCEVVIAGNHDLAVAGDPEINQDLVPGLFQGGPGAGIHHAIKVIEPELLSALARLSPSRIVGDIELHHGSSRDPIWEYVRTAEAATEHLKLQSKRFGAVGHTHMPLLWELEPGSAAATGGLMPADAVFELSGDTKRVINPGSVGQPRDRDNRAAWAALVDGSIYFHRTEYDISRARAAIASAGLPDESGERLELGW